MCSSSVALLIKQLILFRTDENAPPLVSLIAFFSLGIVPHSTIKTSYIVVCLSCRGMAELWHMILERMNVTNKIFQNPMLDINNAVALLSSLQDFISTLQQQFDIFERRGQDLTGVDDFQRKKRSTTHHDDGYTDGTDLNDRYIFKVDSFLVIIDKLTIAMSGRIKAYGEVCRLFGFFARFEDIDDKELKRAVEQLANTFQNNVEDSLVDEIVQCVALLDTPVMK